MDGKKFSNEKIISSLYESFFCVRFFEKFFANIF